MRLVRSRIQVGSGGVLYLMVTLMVLSAAIYTQANVLFAGFGLLIGGLVVSVLYSLVTMRHIEMKRLLPQHAVVGEELTLRYEITNSSRLLPVFSLTLREDFKAGWRKKDRLKHVLVRLLKSEPFGWVLHVGPGQSVRVEAPSWPRTRGSIEFNRLTLSSGFPFGVLTKRLVFEGEDRILVYPGLYRIERSLMQNLTGALAHSQRSLNRPGGGDDFFGLREYRSGDSLRTIDWKRTARTGTLVSREMTQPSPPQMALLLDLREPPPDGIGGGMEFSGRELEERAISLAASLVCEAYLHGMRASLTVSGPPCASFPPMHNLPHRGRMLEALAGLDLDKRDTAQHIEAGRINLIVWAGHGSGTAGTTCFAASESTMVLGASDFDRYVIGPQLNLSQQRSDPQAVRALSDSVRRGEAG